MLPKLRRFGRFLQWSLGDRCRSLSRPNSRRSPGGLFVLHARALIDNGQTYREIIDHTKTLTGCVIERAYVDKGYRRHSA